MTDSRLSQICGSGIVLDEGDAKARDRTIRPAITVGTAETVNWWWTEIAGPDRPFLGIWQPSTAYKKDQVIYDPTTEMLHWYATRDHTSAATWAEDVAKTGVWEPVMAMVRSPEGGLPPAGRELVSGSNQDETEKRLRMPRMARRCSTDEMRDRVAECLKPGVRYDRLERGQKPDGTFTDIWNSGRTGTITTPDWEYEAGSSEEWGKLEDGQSFYTAGLRLFPAQTPSRCVLAKGSGTATTANHFAEHTWGDTATSDGGAGPTRSASRILDGANHFGVWDYFGQLRGIKVVANGITTWGTYTRTRTLNDVERIESDGDAHRIFYNGSPVMGPHNDPFQNTEIGVGICIRNWATTQNGYSMAQGRYGDLGTPPSFVTAWATRGQKVVQPA